MERCNDCGNISVAWDPILQKFRCLMANCTWEGKEYYCDENKWIDRLSEFKFNIDKYSDFSPERFIRETKGKE